MQCDNCGAVNPEAARFCGSCGQLLASPLLTCPRCGAQVAPERFSCPQCGRPTVPAQPAEEVPEAPRRSEPVPATEALPLRGLSDLISETLRLYRQRLGLFLGIALITQLPGLVSLAVESLALEIVLAIIGFVLVAVGQGGMIYGVAGNYLGLPTSVGACFARATQQAVSLVTGQFMFTVLLFMCLALSFLLIGIPLFFLLLVLLGFYPQGIMLENQSPLNAFRRSSALVYGEWWRVFWIGLVYVATVVAVAIIPAVLASQASDVFGDVVLSLVLVAAMPWVIIGRTLLYFDLRLRKEDFTLDVLGADLGVVSNLEDSGELRP